MESYRQRSEEVCWIRRGSEELTKTITKKDQYRTLPEGVTILTNIKTVLHYRLDDDKKDVKVTESREENITFKKPPGDPTHREIKMKAKSTHHKYPSCYLIHGRREEQMGQEYQQGAGELL
eukprot:780543-Amphidinium_carterae.1